MALREFLYDFKALLAQSDCFGDLAGLRANDRQLEIRVPELKFQAGLLTPLAHEAGVELACLFQQVLPQSPQTRGVQAPILGDLHEVLVNRVAGELIIRLGGPLGISLPLVGGRQFLICRAQERGSQRQTDQCNQQRGRRRGHERSVATCPAS